MSFEFQVFVPSVLTELCPLVDQVAMSRFVMVTFWEYATKVCQNCAIRLFNRSAQSQTLPPLFTSQTAQTPPFTTQQAETCKLTK